MDLTVVLIKPVLVVSRSRTKNLQGSEVNCPPERNPIFLHAVVIGLKVLKPAVQVQLQFFNCQGAFQFGYIEFLGYLLPRWPPPGLDDKVKSGDDKAVVHPAVSTTHGFGQSHVPPVLGPGDDIVNEMPVPRAGMHPCCLVAGWQAEHGVSDGQVVCGTRSEQRESITVALAQSMFSNDIFPGFVVIADTGVEVSEDDGSILFLFPLQ